MRVNLSNNIVRMKSQSQDITYRIPFFKKLKSILYSDFISVFLNILFLFQGLSQDTILFYILFSCIFSLP